MIVFMLNDWVADRLKERGMSQSELARRMDSMLNHNISRMTVNNIVQGKRLIKVDELAAIEKILEANAPGIGFQSVSGSSIDKRIVYQVCKNLAKDYNIIDADPDEFAETVVSLCEHIQGDEEVAQDPKLDSNVVDFAVARLMKR